MAKKNPERFVISPGPFNGQTTPTIIHDTEAKPPKRHGKPFSNEWLAEREARRLNVWFGNDLSRLADAEGLVKVFGPKPRLTLFGVGHSRVGGYKSYLCLVSYEGKVKNVSSNVSGVLGWKWEDNDTVAAWSNPTDLTQKLSYILYKNDKKITMDRI